MEIWIHQASKQRSSMLGNGEEQYTEHFNNVNISCQSSVRTHFENVLTFCIRCKDEKYTKITSYFLEGLNTLLAGNQTLTWINQMCKPITFSHFPSRMVYPVKKPECNLVSVHLHHSACIPLRIFLQRITSAMPASFQLSCHNAFTI